MADATDITGLIRLLSCAGVEFIVVGGVAATMHGSAHVTYDLDILYRRTTDNIQRLAAALAALQPYLRGAPEGLPFVLDAATLTRGLNFTLRTTMGDLDLLGEVTGGGAYEAVLNDTEIARVQDAEVRYVTLPRLIMLKRAAGRRRDLNILAELEALLEERDR